MTNVDKTSSEHNDKTSSKHNDTTSSKHNDKTSSKHNDKTSSQQIVNMRGRIDSSLTLKETVLELGLAHGLANLHEIADYTNLAYRTIANMSHRKPTRRTYLRLAEVFDVDVVDLYRLRIK